MANSPITITAPLTTFITSIGRYCFNKLPFGISSTPEHFQCQMLNKILTDLSGVAVYGCVTCMTFCFLRWTWQTSGSSPQTNWKSQCNFEPTKMWVYKNLVYIPCHVIDAEGIRADPEKTKAIVNMSPPTSVSELRRFLRMVNQLGKFIPNLAQIT